MGVCVSWSHAGILSFMDTYSVCNILSTRLFVHSCPSHLLFLSVCLFTRPPVHPFCHLAVCSSAPQSPSLVRPRVHPSAHPSTHLLACLSIIFLPPPHPHALASIRQSHYPPSPICLSVCPVYSPSCPHFRPSMDGTTFMLLSCLRRFFSGTFRLGTRQSYVLYLCLSRLGINDVFSRFEIFLGFPYARRVAGRAVASRTGPIILCCRGWNDHTNAVGIYSLHQ